MLIVIFSKFCGKIYWFENILKIQLICLYCVPAVWPRGAAVRPAGLARDVSDYFTRFINSLIHILYLWLFRSVVGRIKKLVTKRRRPASSNSDNDNDDDYVPSASEGASEHIPSMDTESGDDEEINISAYQGPRKQWKADEYVRARNTNQYALENDATLPQFHTQVQQDAFFGLLSSKTVFKHKFVDWDFIGQYPIMSGLIPIFQRIMLFSFTKHKCDWNENVVRQFYATVELNFEENEIE